jgi:SEC-C motif-containing protein
MLALPGRAASPPLAKPLSLSVSSCPCGTGRAYADCCGPLIDAGLPAPTAEVLMRSRYTAYVRRREDHLLATWHPATRPQSVDFDPPPTWLELRVLRHTPDPADPDRAVVEFAARLRVQGRGHRLHETSRFVREGGRWFYVGAEEGERKA